MDKQSKSRLKHLGLFIITFCTTTIAGAEWMYGKFLYQTAPSLSWQEIQAGLHFSIPFLLILTCHEFGHYFTARSYKINVTLPFYIPLWLGFIPGVPLPSFGTMGAVIRIKDRIMSRTQYFDVGIAGPLAGFVVAMFVIWYGFTHLPEPEYIYQVHPEYEQYGLDYAQHVYDDPGMSIRFGNNIIYWFFMEYMVEDPSLIPHPNEIIHYPYLLAGYLALFFTALNLLPIGQLDGGHIIFGLLGSRSSVQVSRVLFTLLLFYSGLGILTPQKMVDLTWSGIGDFLLILVVYLYFLYISAYSLFEQKRNRWMYAAIVLTTQFVASSVFAVEGYTGWMLFALILGRFMGIYHPPVSDNKELSLPRKVLGWIALVIFILSFSPQPLIIDVPVE